MNEREHDHVGIAVADATRPGVEDVPARHLRGSEWQLLRSPLYARNAAAGDTIKLLSVETGAFEVIARGGKVCVHFYLAGAGADDAEATARACASISADVESLGGNVAGSTPGLIAFTMPSKIGFPAIEELFIAAIGRHPGAQWEYTNVYDPSSGEPLRWWE